MTQNQGLSVMKCAEDFEVTSTLTAVIPLLTHGFHLFTFSQAKKLSRAEKFRIFQGGSTFNPKKLTDPVKTDENVVYFSDPRLVKLTQLSIIIA